MLGARLIAPAAPPGGKRLLRSRASSPPAATTTDAADATAAARHHDRRRLPSPGLELPLVALSFPPDFADRALVMLFGTTVIGQLYTWPLAMMALYSLLKSAMRSWRDAQPTAAAAALLLAASLLLYLRFILGRGFREAEVTPNVLLQEDQEAGQEGKKQQRIKWWRRAPLRRWRQWSRLRAFTGATLARSGPPLDPQRAYVFAGYPHGISAISAFANLVVDPVRLEGEEQQEEALPAREQEVQSRRLSKGDEPSARSGGSSSSGSDEESDDNSAVLTRGSSWQSLFPGITMHAMTLASNFKAPLVREYCLSLGLRPATRSSCSALLTEPCGRYDVILARRKGFCRVAVATGADVVPVLMFGETELFDVWHPSPGSRAWRLQRLSHRLFGTSQPIFSGEGLFGPQFKGLLPRRWSPGCGRPRLTTVVGQPVRVEGGPWRGGGEEAGTWSWPPRIPKRGADLAFERAVDALHARYVAALRELFDQHAPTLHPGAVLRVADAVGEEGEMGGASPSASSKMMHH